MNKENGLKKKFQKELLSGISSLVLLSVLGRSDKAMYGYQIAKMLEAEERESPLKQGALYPVLRSLEKNNLLESNVEPSISGPPRRYYAITTQGREALSEWTRIWQKTVEFVNAAL